MTAFYNEIDPYAAQWLRNLIAAGHIAPGVVDERSIEDLEPYELRRYTQCHFFAGIGVWSYALRLAGWPDDRPVWTGSCPCQPFSAAGKGAGFADDRHLWPEFHRLIAECRPPVVFGEQVASKDGLNWLDTVHADLEASGYALAAADLCAAGIGAPHIRQRLWFVGERLDNSAGARHFGAVEGAKGNSWDEARLRLSGEGCGSGGLADAASIGREMALQHAGSVGSPNAERQANVAGGNGASSRPSPTNGHWRNADWLLCRDGKWRPVEPGTFPLAHGAPARVGRLRAYGNAIVPQVAATFIAAYLAVREA